ncbi:MAG: cation:proton antiporter subunit C [Methanomicrobia archaeon]|nr:cation:proton antiporter subunit C [Methanomicrobia archaeon]
MEWLTQEILAKYNYWIAVIIILIGFYAMIAKDNLIKKLIGLSLFQTGIFLYFISLGDVGVGWGLRSGTTYIIEAIPEGYIYINPLPTALILTAIVVSVSTLAVSLGLVIRIYEEYETIEESEIIEKERVL